uniref:PPUP8970 n=1 Tax=Poeciliopsis prolifica TaxID=188132 RepID=A0A0S7ESX4_9TELE
MFNEWQQLHEHVLSTETVPRLSYHSCIAFFTLWLHTKTAWSRKRQTTSGDIRQSLRTDGCCQWREKHILYGVIWMDIPLTHALRRRLSFPTITDECVKKHAQRKKENDQKQTMF